MPAWVSSIFGESMAPIAWVVIVAALVCALAVATIVLARKVMGARGGLMARSRDPRLAIADVARVDDKRRLILVRRDDVEHLILVGGQTDITVEAGIRRSEETARWTGSLDNKPSARRDEPALALDAGLSADDRLGSVGGPRPAAAATVAASPDAGASVPPAVRRTPEAPGVPDLVPVSDVARRPEPASMPDAPRVSDAPTPSPATSGPQSTVAPTQKAPATAPSLASAFDALKSRAKPAAAQETSVAERARAALRASMNRSQSAEPGRVQDASSPADAHPQAMRAANTGARQPAPEPDDAASVQATPAAPARHDTGEATTPAGQRAPAARSTPEDDAPAHATTIPQDHASQGGAKAAETARQPLSVKSFASAIQSRKASPAKPQEPTPDRTPAPASKAPSAGAPAAQTGPEPGIAAPSAAPTTGSAAPMRSGPRTDDEPDGPASAPSMRSDAGGATRSAASASFAATGAGFGAARSAPVAETPAQPSLEDFLSAELDSDFGNDAFFADAPDRAASRSRTADETAPMPSLMPAPRSAPIETSRPPAPAPSVAPERGRTDDGAVPDVSGNTRDDSGGREAPAVSVTPAADRGPKPWDPRAGARSAAPSVETGGERPDPSFGPASGESQPWPRATATLPATPGERSDLGRVDPDPREPAGSAVEAPRPSASIDDTPDASSAPAVSTGTDDDDARTDAPPTVSSDVRGDEGSHADEAERPTPLSIEEEMERLLGNVDRERPGSGGRG